MDLVRKHLVVSLPPAVWELLKVQWRLVCTAAREQGLRQPARSEVTAALLMLVLMRYREATLAETEQRHEEIVGRALARHLPDAAVERRRVRQRRARAE
jgi:hypothetical protein